MTIKKRGLGRGLEALLADVPDKDGSRLSGIQEEAGNGATQGVQIEEAKISLLDSQAVSQQLSPLAANTSSIEGQAEIAQSIANINQERVSLLEEAEILRQLICEFESIVRTDLL